ncbi:MAG: PKD domain-containing protein [Candidatus Abyssobacteria bacterium SURF_5]|uniref:PKD domain-containing protein n=1 Tax=Abyssobacteria bacterium (strain SURF_5) TaxID=2093360 RepID=A0A3A4NYX5_ABYX5|nr:MAG: PKD domain-containing protein [Candidatus Abyssubacteria bacterium SURF_5]
MLSGKRVLSFLILLTVLLFIPAGAAAQEPAITLDAEALLTAGATTSPASPPTAAFGINTYVTGETLRMENIVLDVIDEGTGLPIVPTDFGSFRIYRDSGTLPGQFDSSDQSISTGSVVDLGKVGVAFSVNFDLTYTIPLDNLAENYGNDLFVVFQTSSSIQEGQSFSLVLPANGILITRANPPWSGTFPDADVVAGPITVNLMAATLTISSLVTPGQGILPRSGPVEVIGLNGYAQQEYRIAYVIVTIENEGEFPEDGLQEVTPSDFISFELYRDSMGERNGIFDPATDGDPIASAPSPGGIPPSTSFDVIITVPPDELDAILPVDDQGDYAGNDFFICIRTSDTIDSDFDDEDYDAVDDFHVVLRPGAIYVPPTGAGEHFFFPPFEATDFVTGAIVPEGLVLDLQPIAMDRTDLDSQYHTYPGSYAEAEDLDVWLRYHYAVLGDNLRWKYLGERDRLFSGLGRDTIEAYVGSFEQPIAATLERRHEIIALDLAGGTADNPEYLTGITLTLSNLGPTLRSMIDFDPSFGIDPISCACILNSFFSGITVYEDTNGDGEYTEPPLDEYFNFDPTAGDQPVLANVVLTPGLFTADWYNTNFDETHYMLQLEFLDPPELESISDHKSDFFVVFRLDSGYADDSDTAGDGTSVNVAADFKISLERAEDLNRDGVWDRIDYNSDNIPQTPAVRFGRSTPLDSLTILAHSPDPYVYLEMSTLAAVMWGQDLSMNYGCCSNPIPQRVNATSLPTSLIAINAARSDIPTLDNPAMEPYITDIRLNFSGEGFDPTDIEDVLLVRDDKSPYHDVGLRTVGVFDIFNDLWNHPPPGSSYGALINPEEESPIPVTPWTWRNDGTGYYLILTPDSAQHKARIYPDDDIEPEESLDVFTDNFEILPDSGWPQDTVFSGADYFICIQTTDTISYGDEIKIEIPHDGLGLSSGSTVLEPAALIDPESPGDNVHSVLANVPVKLHGLVQPGQEIDANSGMVPVMGFNMYTNRPPAAEGGVDVYLEMLVIAFLQYGTRDSFNIVSDLLPFEGINGRDTAMSGIQLYRDANGNGIFDGPAVDTLVIMDDTSETLGVNPSRVGLIGDDPNQVLMVFSSPENRQPVPPTDAGTDAGDDFFLVIQTSPTFERNEDNFSVAMISWGPDSPDAPAPHQIEAGGNRPYDAISYYQVHPWTRRGMGFVDSDGVRTRSTESMATNVFNATRTTLLQPVENFRATLESPLITDPSHQILLLWEDTNADDPGTPYFNENESGYWIESNVYGEFTPLPDSLLQADATSYFFDGPPFLAGRTVEFRIMPYRNNVIGIPQYPPFNGPGPTASTSATLWPSQRPEPIARFTASETSGCAPMSVCFTNDTIGEGPITYLWDFDDGQISTEENPCHTFTGMGTYQVCLTATNAWGSHTTCKAITASEPPTADFIMDKNYTCINQPVQFTSTSTGNPTQYLWDFGDGKTSTLPDPSHTYTSAGDFTVTLTVSNNCPPGSSTTKTVTVVGALIADFSYSPTDGCAPATVTFTDLSTCEPTEWLWDFGDGQTSSEQNPSHLYSEPGTYAVCLTAGNGITDNEKCVEVVVYDAPVAMYLAERACAYVGEELQFTDISTGNPTEYLWDFGDGSTSPEQNPTHAYSAAGEYTVVMTAGNSCGVDTTQPITIRVADNFTADFSYSPTDACTPGTIQFTDLSMCDPAEWCWFFGDGTTSTEQNPLHLYTSPGTYIVTLQSGDGLTKWDEEIKTIVLTSCNPVIALDPAVLNNSCPAGSNAPAQTFTVKNAGSGMLSYQITESAYWFWLSPTSGTSTGEEDVITVTYTSSSMAPGTYTARITVSAPGADNSPQYLDVYLTVGSSELTQINLIAPRSGQALSSPPAFSWTCDGGQDNAFAVEFALSPSGPWKSSYEDLGKVITGTSWSLPLPAWNKVPAGSQIYWRVRGTDRSKQPRTVITSDEVWSFHKN